MTTLCNDGSSSYGKERDKFFCLVRTGEVTGLESTSENSGEIRDTILVAEQEKI